MLYFIETNITTEKISSRCCIISMIISIIIITRYTKMRAI